VDLHKIKRDNELEILKITYGLLLEELNITVKENEHLKKLVEMLNSELGYDLNNTTGRPKPLSEKEVLEFERLLEEEED